MLSVADDNGEELQEEMKKAKRKPTQKNDKSVLLHRIENRNQIYITR